VTYYVECVNTVAGDVTRLGEVALLRDAVSLAKQFIDKYLALHQEYNASADSLYSTYVASGLHPVLFKDEGETMNVRTFDHLQYAAVQCVRLYRKSSIPAPDTAECASASPSCSCATSD
jgi:hypothetical protein